MSDHSSPLTADNAQGSNIACSLGETLALIGDRWVLMILHSAFTGNTRFSDIQRATAMSRSLLTRRLKRMESLGLLSKRLYDEQRNRYDYILTEKGADLADTAMMIVRWEQRWYPGAPSQLSLYHACCDSNFTPVFSCSHCSEEVFLRDMFLREGPGAGLKQSSDVRRSSITAPSFQQDQAMIGWAGVILGDRWTPVLIVSPFFGITRFNDFSRFWGIAPNILSDRLNRLIELKMINAKVYAKEPGHFEYELSKKGRDFIPVLLTLMAWGNRQLAQEEERPQLLVHKSCGSEFDVVLVCDQCGERVEKQDVQYR